MKTYKLSILPKTVFLLLCCFASTSYADKPYSGKYDHSKPYFDYYDEKPSSNYKEKRHARRDKKPRHVKRPRHPDVVYSNQHRHTAYCERRHNHFVYDRPKHHRRHSHRNGFNSGLAFVFQFVY